MTRQDLKGKIQRGGVERESAGMPVDDDAAAALLALGYTPAEALGALQGIPPAGSATTEERVTAALRASVSTR